MRTRRHNAPNALGALDLNEAVGDVPVRDRLQLLMHSEGTGEKYDLGFITPGESHPDVGEIMQVVPTLTAQGVPLIIFSSDSKYVELAHGKQVLLWDSEENVARPLRGWPGALPRLRDTKELARAMAEAIRARDWRFDTICTLSTTALPLVYSYLYLVEREINLVACDNITGHFMPESFLHEDQKGQVLLVDAIVQSGEHVERAWQALTESGHSVAGFIAVLRNDILPPGEHVRPFLRELFEKREAAYLVLASEVLAAWKNVKATKTV